MKVLVPLFLALLMAACSIGGQERNDLLDWELVPNDHAHAFRILKKGQQRTIVIFGPGGHTDTLGIHLIGSGSDGERAPLPPLERVVVTTTTHLPYLGALGKEGIVVGAVHLRDVYDRRFKELARNGAITDVGTADGMDMELLVTLRPQVIFDHPFGRQSVTSNALAAPVVLITEYLEEHPLGRAEWIKVFGVLTGRESLADSLYQGIKSRYLSVSEKASSVESRPKVFFGSRWQGQWFAPPANSYMATLIKDAGAGYVFDEHREGNITLDLESVLHKVRRSDHFGMILTNTGEITPTVLAGGEKRLEKIPAVDKGGFYGDASSSDLFGQALLEPDVILQDLFRIFHPELGDTLQPRYFRKIGT